MKYKKTIIMTILIFLVLIIGSSSLISATNIDVCYQEQANSSSSRNSGNCNFNYSGNYTWSDSSNDGNESTGTQLENGEVIYYFPLNRSSLYNATIRITKESSENNLSVDNSCLINGSLKIKYEGYCPSGWCTTTPLYAYCYNGSDYISIGDTGTKTSGNSADSLYEEGIYWTYQVPEVTNIYTSPSGNNVPENNTIKGYCELDFTNPNPEGTYKWLKDSTVIKTGTFTPINGVTMLVDNLSYTQTHLGDNIYFSCSGKDDGGEGQTNITNKINFVGDHAQITNIGINSSNPLFSTKNISGFCSAISTGYNREINYKWYKNGFVNESGSISFVPNEQKKFIIDSSKTSYGDEWVLSCQATDNDENSSWVNSTTINITDSLISFKTQEYATNNVLDGVSYYLYDVLEEETVNGSHYWNFNNNFDDAWGTSTQSGNPVYQSDYPVFNIEGSGNPKSIYYSENSPMLQLMTDNEADAMGSSYSYSIWFKSQDHSSSNNYLIERWNYFTFQISQGSNFPQDIIYYNSYSGTKTIQDVINDSSKWYNLVFTQNNVDGGETKIYLNGKLLDTYTQSSTNTRDSIVHLGKDGNDNYNFRGGIDEVKSWNKILNDTEIENIYNYGAANPDINLTPLNEENNSFEAGTHKILATKNNYFNLLQEFSFSKESQETRTLTGMGNNELTITANDSYSGDSINEFSGWVYQDYYGTNTSFSTSNGHAEIILLTNETYTVHIDAPLYASQNEELFISGRTQSKKFSLSKAHSLFVTFKDLETNNLLQPNNITLELINSESYVLSTTNGKIYKEDLVNGDYVARYSSDGYNEALQYFTIDDDTGYTFTWYLSNDTTTQNVEVTVLDGTAKQLEGATVKALRYNINSNSYELQESGQTNTEGKTNLHLTINDEFYKFVVEYEGEVVKVTTPAYITSNTLIIQVDTGDDILKNYFEYLSIDASLVFNTNSDNFRFTYNDADNIANNYCLKVYEQTSNSLDFLTQTCLTSSAGSILIGVTPKNGTTYVAKAFYNENYLLSVSYTYPEGDILGKTGLFLQIILTLTFAFLSLYAIKTTPLAIAGSLLLGRLVHLNILPWTAIIGSIVIGLILAFILGRRR